jgi:hypothetical protein
MYPISSIIHYLKYEKFEYLFIVAQPAHLHFFYEAGITNSAFYPRISLNFEEVSKKMSGVTYIGKKWKNSHLRKSRMVQFLEKELLKSNVPYRRFNRLSKSNWRKVLTYSKMTVISSLNGQFTPQIYSCLYAGTLCFIDKLRHQSFLYDFFEPNKHLIIWSNFEDLLQKLNYYYNHPVEAEKIAKEGKIQAEMGFATSNNLPLSISEFVFDNKIDQRLLAINDKRCQSKRVENVDYFNARVRLYENIQDLHRIHESINLISLTEKNLKPSADLADLPRLRITHAFLFDSSKKEGDEFFQRVGVSHQIQTALLNKIKKSRSFNIGILETSENPSEWKFLVKSITKLLKSSSLLWILGKLTKNEYEILKKEGFRTYVQNRSSRLLKLKEISRKICYQFWKMGLYPFPYLTLKPAMETVPNLHVFLRGWQAYLQFLY